MPPFFAAKTIAGRPGVVSVQCSRPSGPRARTRPSPVAVDSLTSSVGSPRNGSPTMTEPNDAPAGCVATQAAVPAVTTLSTSTVTSTA